MTFRYYLRHCLWSLVGCGSLVYNILTDLKDGKIFPSYVLYIPYVAAYPFAYYALEISAQKIIQRNPGIDFLVILDHQGIYSYSY